MKHKTVLFFSMSLLIIICVGCEQQSPKDTLQIIPSEQLENSVSGNQKNDGETLGENGYENPANGDMLFQISNLNGTVVDFYDDGCKISPTIKEGENIAYGAAPGYEKEEDMVSVVYDTGCTFQIAHANYQTTEIIYEAASIDDVKKQTSLIICGEYNEDNVLHASRVFILRYEGK